jgi:hypothetical protein
MPHKIQASTTPAPGNSEGGVTLSELCTEAAKHVAQARIALFSQSVDTDGALDHLDQAIFCLQRLSAQGRAAGLDRASAKFRSA